ncbi:MAG TPA: hypothetical protein VGE98_14480 [Thermoanaerobaculia bacterium]
MNLRPHIVALFALFLVPGVLLAIDPPEPDAPHFSDSVSVSIASVLTRILDPNGAPIADLKPGEVKVEVGGKSVPIVAVDYYDNSVAPGDLPDDRVTLKPGQKGPGAPLQVSGRGQLFVIFVETDFQGRTIPKDRAELLKKMVDSLKPTDLAAVVSLDDSFKLQSDFTLDRRALFDAIVRSRKEGDPPAPPAAPGPLSLARGWNAAAAQKAAHTEAALSVLAAALDPLPGEKVVLFIGHAKGHFQLPLPAGKYMTSEFGAAVHALRLARAGVFVLDEPWAVIGGHPRPVESIYAALRETLAQVTGGTYLQLLPDGQAIDRMMRVTRGYHLVTLDLQQITPQIQAQPLKVSLAGRPGATLTEPIHVVRLKS